MAFRLATLSFMLLLALLCIHAKERRAPPVMDVNGEAVESGRRIRMRAHEHTLGGGITAEYERKQREREIAFDVLVQRDANAAGDEFELERVEEHQRSGESNRIELGDEFYVRVRRRASSSREEEERKYYWGVERREEEEEGRRHIHYYAVVVRREDEREKGDEKEERSRFCVMGMPGGLYALQACVENNPRRSQEEERRGNEECVTLGFKNENGRRSQEEERRGNEECVTLGFKNENGNRWLRTHYEAAAIDFDQQRPRFSIFK